MKQLIWTLFLVCAAAFSIPAQSSNVISDKQWKDLISAVGSENWDVAVSLSTDYLKLPKVENDTRVARLRYVYLFSAAGKVSEGKMSYDDLEKSVKQFVGKEIVFPYRQIKKDCSGDFNFVCPGDTKDRAMVTAANRAGTSILAFEYIQLKENFDFAKHNKKSAEVGGSIKSIEPNPNRSNLVILRIYVSDGYIGLTGK